MIKQLALAGLLALAPGAAHAACTISNSYPFKDAGLHLQAYAATVLPDPDCRVLPWEILVDSNGTAFSGSYGLPVSQQGIWTFGLTGPIPAGTNLIGHMLVDNLPATQPVSAAALPLPAGAATAAAQATLDADLKATQPRAIASNAPSVGQSGPLSAIGDTVQLTVDGMNTVTLQLPSGAWSGTVAVDASADGGATWTQGLNVIPYAGGAAAGSLTAGGLWEMAAGGLTTVRLRAVTAITGGPITAVLRATNGLKSIRVGNPSGNPLTVNQSGSTGTDYSDNPSAVPVAGYLLLATIPATAARAFVEVQNQSAGPIQVVRDDGAGNNQTTILLAPGSGAGAQGGGWSSATFKGRLRIYAATSTAQVAAYQD